MLPINKNTLDKKITKWFAVYVKSRYEKKINQLLIEKGVETYLPLQKNLKQWSDRKKWVEEPLFRSYLFTKINKTHYYIVLKTAGVVKFVTFEGQAVPIPEKQIDTIKKIVNSEYCYETSNHDFEIGELVEVHSGPLKGMKGELLEYRGKQKVIIRVDTVGHSILVDIPAGLLKHKKK